MATDNPQAKFSVVLDDKVSDAANSAADSVEALRDRMVESESSIKEMAAAMRRLRGNTVEVKQAKEQLKARMGALKDSISATSLAMLKQGATVESLAAKEKKAAEKLAEKTKLAAEGTKRNTEGLSRMRNVALGVVGVFAAIAAVAGAAFVSLGKFVIGAADASRSMNLMREAAAGSKANAVALGSQIDLLGSKVPTSTAALNDLAVSMAKGGIGGQTLVDTLNAVGQANAALGDDAGSKLRELVDRGRLSQRFFVNPLEMQGSGLQFDDIAKALSEQMHVGVAKAREALMTGKVKLADGAAAMRKAVESKFGDINLDKLTTLAGLSETIHKKLVGLTAGFDLSPALKEVAGLFKMFDQSTYTGVAMKEMVTLFGKGLVKAIQVSAPVAKKFFQGMIISALQVTIQVIKLRNWLKVTFGDAKILKDINTLQIAFDTGKASLSAMAAAVAALGAALAVALAPFAAIIACFTVIPALGASAGRSLRKAFLEIDWSATGTAIIDGLIGGLKSGASRLVNTVKELGTSIKDSFAEKLQIHSPSKVFEGYGRNTVDGYREGVESRAPKAAAALDEMTGTPSGGARGGRGAAQVTLNLTLNVNSAGGDVAKQLSDQSILAPLLKAIENALIGAGIPVTAIAT